MNNQQKLALIIGFLICFSAVFAPIFYFFILPSIRSRQHLNYVYPNPLWSKTKYSDMVVEDDTSIHFVISNSSSEGDNNLVYLNYRYENDGISYSTRFGFSAWFLLHQVRINLKPNNVPLIFASLTSSFFIPVGEIYEIMNDEWEKYLYFGAQFNSLPSNVSELARRYLYNWRISPSGNVSLAFLYGTPYFQSPSDPDAYTPVIYNESSREAFFFHILFPEIDDFNNYAPGDFKCSDSSLAVLWTRKTVLGYYQPYIVIYWSEEGWQLLKLGENMGYLIPISILPQDSFYNVFYYSKGEQSNQSEIFLTTIYNSTHSITEKLTSFNGKLSFYQDSILSLSDNSYIFLYTRTTSEKSIYTDLFLGLYDGEQFIETQLTNTPTYSENWANCELGKEYFHYAWTQCTLDGNGQVKPEESVLYYNRTLIRDLQTLKSNNHKLQTMNEYLHLNLDVFPSQVIHCKEVCTIPIELKYSCHII